MVLGILKSSKNQNLNKYILEGEMSMPKKSPYIITMIL